VSEAMVLDDFFPLRRGESIGAATSLRFQEKDYPAFLVLRPPLFAEPFL